MGVNDKLWVKLTCSSCDVSETSTALDKGYNNPSWGNIEQFEKFIAINSGGGKQEPEVVSAKCKTCGAIAIIESKYGFTCPSGY